MLYLDRHIKGLILMSKVKIPKKVKIQFSDSKGLPLSPHFPPTTTIQASPPPPTAFVGTAVGSDVIQSFHFHPADPCDSPETKEVINIQGELVLYI